MTTETTEMLRPVLSDEDVATLNAARRILEEVEKRAQERGNAIVGRHVEERTTWLPMDTPTPQSCGRVAEAANRAESELFQLLNLASSHRVSVLSDDQVHGRLQEEAAETPEMLHPGPVDVSGNHWDVLDEPGPDLSDATEHDPRL